MKCAWAWCNEDAVGGHWCPKHEARLGDALKDVETERVEDQ